MKGYRKRHSRHSCHPPCGWKWSRLADFRCLAAPATSARSVSKKEGFIPRWNRSELSAAEEIQAFHLTNRCVRCTYRCGKDVRSAKDCLHCREWIRVRARARWHKFTVPKVNPRWRRIRLWHCRSAAVADDDCQIKRQTSTNSLCKQNFRVQLRQWELRIR